jgi:hypothetical protein
LKFAFNHIKGKGGQAIANQIQVSPNLQILDASFNTLTGHGKIP